MIALAKAWIGGILVVAFAPEVMAQASRVEVSGGYAITHAEDQTLPVGWSAGVAANLNRTWSLVAEANGAYKTESDEDLGTDVKLKIHSVSGGARWSIRVTRVVPFVQVLAGAAHLSARARVLDRRVGDAVTKFTLQPGAGVDFEVNDSLGVIGQVDYRRVFFDEQDAVAAGENQWRAVIGIRFSL